MSFKVDSITNDPSKFYVACMDMRFGTQVFASAVEYYLYPPHIKEQNDLFEISKINYQGYLFHVISVPREDEAKVKEIARSIGMRVADGVPTLMGQSPFPLQGKNVWNLENQERRNTLGFGRATPTCPFSPERVQIDHIIREAARIWNADVHEDVIMDYELGEIKTLRLLPKAQ